MSLITSGDADSIGFTWTGTGTGDVVVGSALPKHRVPGAALDGLAVSLRIQHADAATDEWEETECVYTHSTTTFARLAGNVIAGSAGAGVLTSFSVGTKNCYVTFRGPDFDGVFAPISHTHAAADVTSGTFADARIAGTNVTQHQASIDHDALTNFAANEHIDWTLDQGATDIHANNIPDLSATYATAAQGALANTAIQPADAVTQLDGTSNRLLYIDAAGNVTELAYGTLDYALRSDGVASPPVWEPPVNVEHSLEGSGTAADPVHLANDLDAPGNSKYYGTSDVGTKGWHDLTGDAAPTQVTSTGTPHALADAERLHLNVDVFSHAAVDFEVPQAASAGSKWLVKPQHDGCTVSVNGDTGSVNGSPGGTRSIINGGRVVIEVEDNPASAPVVVVSGSVIEPQTATGAKTYNDEDSGQEFEITSGTQTFGAAATFADGFTVNLYNHTGGDITIDGVDADHTLPSPGALTVVKLGTALMAVGTGGTTTLDAA